MMGQIPGIAMEIDDIATRFLPRFKMGRYSPGVNFITRGRLIIHVFRLELGAVRIPISGYGLRRHKDKTISQTGSLNYRHRPG